MKNSNSSNQALSFSKFEFSIENIGHQQQENAPLHTVVAPLPVGRDEDEVFVDLELRLEVRPVNG